MSHDSLFFNHNETIIIIINHSHRGNSKQYIFSVCQVSMLNEEASRVTVVCLFVCPSVCLFVCYRDSPNP